MYVRSLFTGAWIRALSEVIAEETVKVVCQMLPAQIVCETHPACWNVTGPLRNSLKH